MEKVTNFQVAYHPYSLHLCIGLSKCMGFESGGSLFFSPTHAIHWKTLEASERGFPPPKKNKISSSAKSLILISPCLSQPISTSQWFRYLKTLQKTLRFIKHLQLPIQCQPPGKRERSYDWIIEGQFVVYNTLPNLKHGSPQTSLNQIRQSSKIFWHHLNSPVIWLRNMWTICFLIIHSQ